jgi:sialic acid synthase SpsE
MKRIIQLSQGIIRGNEVQSILEILPQLESSFTQRKTYFEYNFEDTEVELTLEQIDKLSKDFGIEIGFGSLTINVN